MEGTIRSNEDYYITTNGKMNNTRMNSMLRGRPKNNNSETTLRVNGLDENKNGCSR